MSFNGFEAGGLIHEAFTADSYIEFFSSTFNLGIIGRTLYLGVVVTAGAFLLGFPLALFLLRTNSRWKSALLVLALAPLLTSAVVRTFGWMAILGDEGIVNETLKAIGLISQPIKLANNELGVIIALVEILMPYMILSVVTGSSRLNDTTLEASATLGGGPIRTFFRVVLPLTMPGIVTGCLLVFVLTISSFVTPALVGGGRVFTMATEIFDQAVNSLNWPLAAAISFILMTLFAGVLVGYQRIMNRLDWSRSS
ncbi:polyamine ABC transporter permease [Arthrobacter sp. StoSoilB5]|nr:polyamine ABC transporter permease [Arthrobacter sp. StoSoilB5]